MTNGAKVVIGDILQQDGDALATELGPAARFVRHDVTNEAGWQEAVETAVKLGGGLHGLINNAGIYIPKSLMETDSELFERHVRINQFGCFLGMRAVVPAMERSGGGSIVNISSTAGLRGTPYTFAYGATKWALRGMTKSAAAGPRLARLTCQLSPSWSDRHGDAEDPHAGGERALNSARTDEAGGNGR